MSFLKLDNLPPPSFDKIGWPWRIDNNLFSMTIPENFSWPKISIITPSYNQAKYIEETIRSVILQDYPNIEYIIVDGGSTDGSLEIIKKYERWLTYWISEPDKGQAAAINKGFHVASGDIVAWINSDDTYNPNVLRKVALFFHSNADVDFVYGNVRIIDEDSHEQEVLTPNDINDISNAGFYVIHQPSCFWKRHTFQRAGYLNEEMHYIFDMEFWLRLHEYYKFSMTHEIYSNARFHSETKTANKQIEFALETLSVYERYFNSGKILIDPDRKKRALRIWNESIARRYLRINDYKNTRKFFRKAIGCDLVNISNIKIIFDIFKIILKN